MRPNRRAEIVEAAKRHLAEHGLDGLRLEQVALAVGMTTQGLRYHFRSAQDLALAVGESIAVEWEAELEGMIGRPLSLATPAELTRAYVAVLLTGDRDVHDLLVLVHIAMAPELDEEWNGRIRMWLRIPAPLEDITRMRLLHAQVLAEGLFARFATGTDRADPSHVALSRLAFSLTRV